MIQIWGQCPKCRQWFDADEWFDRSVPTPVCPTCALGPAMIRYVYPEAPSPREFVHAAPAASDAWIG